MNIADALHNLEVRDDRPGVLTSLPPKWAALIEQGKQEIAARRTEFGLGLPGAAADPLPGAVKPIEDPALVKRQRALEALRRMAPGHRRNSGVPSC